VGNLPYDATVQDIRNFFAEFSTSIQDIDMSIDDTTKRNPSYCFLDCNIKEEADMIIYHYDGLSFMGRQLKVKPRVKAGTGTGQYHLKDSNSTS
jgi:RNA recognition motif-containing protein